MLPHLAVPCQACVFEAAKEDFVTNVEGLNLLRRSWSPETGTKGAVLLVHGFSWHSEYFRDFAEALSEAGVSLLLLEEGAHAS